MRSDRLGRTLALGVLAVAVFNTLASLSLPVLERKPAPAAVLLILALLVIHAAVYWFGESLRIRFGIARYVALQALLVFAIGLAGDLIPLCLGLYVALTAQTVILAENQWSSLAITLAAIVLFAVNAMAARDLYQGATAGLLLAITGVVSHAVAAVVNRRPATVAAADVVAPIPGNGESFNLTPRELEVLREIVSGARSSQIATDLRITERTVKAHLASIYQKMGVESRAAAVAVAIQQKIV